jgi:hypothetical protein
MTTIASTICALVGLFCASLSQEQGSTISAQANTNSGGVMQLDSSSGPLEVSIANGSDNLAPDYSHLPEATLKAAKAICDKHRMIDGSASGSWQTCTTIGNYASLQSAPLSLYEPNFSSTCLAIDSAIAKIEYEKAATEQAAHDALDLKALYKLLEIKP